MDFQLNAKIAVIEGCRKNIGDVTVDDFVVNNWSYILGSSKTYLALKFDLSKVFEVTYDSGSGATYVNHYRKIANYSISSDHLADIRDKLDGRSR